MVFVAEHQLDGRKKNGEKKECVAVYEVHVDHHTCALMSLLAKTFILTLNIVAHFQVIL